MRLSSGLAALLKSPRPLSSASTYTAASGLAYLVAGAVLVFWPGIVQTLFMERAFLGDERALVRVIGLTVAVIGWLYLFGGLTGKGTFVAATVVNRLTFVPSVLVVLALLGVFPRFLLAFALFDAVLAIGAWSILRRRPEAM